MTAPPPLGCEALSWGHPGEPPLGEALSCELGPGEALAVVGPNGAGKTTLMRTLAGLLPARGGRALLSGEDPTSLRPDQRARRVALLPQQALADLELTVAELVELGRTTHLGPWGRLRPADREAIADALAACSLEDKANRPLGQVSGGERQRAQIAMTLAQQAPLLLLDEPTSHLDLRHRHLLYALLAELRATQRLAMVLVLHDLTEAFGEHDRVLVLGEGQARELPASAGGEQSTRAQLAQAFDVPVERIPRLD